MSVHESAHNGCTTDRMLVHHGERRDIPAHELVHERGKRRGGSASECLPERQEQSVTKRQHPRMLSSAGYHARDVSCINGRMVEAKDRQKLPERVTDDDLAAYKPHDLSLDLAEGRRGDEQFGMEPSLCISIVGHRLPAWTASVKPCSGDDGRIRWLHEGVH